MVRDNDCVRGPWSWSDLKFVPVFERSMSADMLMNQNNEAD